MHDTIDILNKTQTWTISVAVLEKVSSHKTFTKFSGNFWQYFASSLSYFPAHPKKLVEKLHINTTLSDIFIFVNIDEIKIVAEILKTNAKFWKTQSLGPKFSGNFCEKYWRNFRCRDTMHDINER